MEQAAQFAWRHNPSFRPRTAVESLWCQRLRHHYGARFDARDALAEWDHGQAVLPVAGIIHHKQFVCVCAADDATRWCGVPVFEGTNRAAAHAFAPPTPRDRSAATGAVRASRLSLATSSTRSATLVCRQLRGGSGSCVRSRCFPHADSLRVDTATTHPCPQQSRIPCSLTPCPPRQLQRACRSPAARSGRLQPSLAAHSP